MVKVRREEKFPTDKRQHLPVVKIRYVRTPDAHARLFRAIDILLRSAAREPKEEEPPQDSRPEGVAGQSDGEEE